MSVSESVISRENADGTVALLHLDNDDYFFTLDGIAAEAWLMLEAKKQPAEIEKKLLQKYPEFKSRLARDLSKLFRDLEKNELISGR